MDHNFDPSQADLKLDIDIDSLTLGEIGDLERISGLSIRRIGVALSNEDGEGDDIPMAGLLQALAYVDLKATYPKITPAQVAKIPLSQLNLKEDAEVEEEEDADLPPPPPAG